MGAPFAARLRLVVHPEWGTQIAVGMPYIEDAVFALKEGILCQARRWDRRFGAWFVAPTERASLERILVRWFEVRWISDSSYLPNLPAGGWDDPPREPPPRPRPAPEPERPRRPAPGPYRPVAGPHAVLGLLPTCDPDVVRAAYRILASKHHPDHGGSASAMAEINAAWEEIRRGST